MQNKNVELRYKNFFRRTREFVDPAKKVGQIFFLCASSVSNSVKLSNIYVIQHGSRDYVSNYQATVAHRLPSFSSISKPGSTPSTAAFFYYLSLERALSPSTYPRSVSRFLPSVSRSHFSNAQSMRFIILTSFISGVYFSSAWLGLILLPRVQRCKALSKFLQWSSIFKLNKI